MLADSPRKNLNTILLFIVLAVLGWTGNTTWKNTIKLAEIGSSLVTRPEMEGKLLSIETDLQKIKMDILTLQVINSRPIK